MRRLALHIIVVGFALAPAVTCIWAIHTTHHATTVYNRTHYGPAELQGPPMRTVRFVTDGMEWSTPEELMRGRLNAEQSIERKGH